jgi:hypothetical protein
MASPPSGRTIVGMLIGLALVLVGFALGSRSGGEADVADLSSSDQTMPVTVDDTVASPSDNPVGSGSPSHDATKAVAPEASTVPQFEPSDDCEGGQASVVKHDISITAGDGCQLDHVDVIGDISVESGGVLVLTGGSISGDIQAEGAEDITLTEVYVRGDLQLAEGGSASVVDTRGEGDLDGERLTGHLVIQDSTIGGDVELVENTQVQILGTKISGDFECEANEPAPEGDDNSVAGDAVGQCDGLG